MYYNTLRSNHTPPFSFFRNFRDGISRTNACRNLLMALASISCTRWRLKPIRFATSSKERAALKREFLLKFILQKVNAWLQLSVPEPVRPVFGEVISRLEGHFPVSRHEPQFEPPAVDVHWRGFGVNVPALASFCRSSCGPDDCYGDPRFITASDSSETTMASGRFHFLKIGNTLIL